METKKYLGDAVYADFDGHGITLTTEDGRYLPTNEIYLECEVIARLLDYVKMVTRVGGESE